MVVFQFEIWQINLNPTHGSEQQGVRPCLIIQTNAANEHSLTIIVAPFTTKKIDRIYPYEVKIIPSKENGLKEISKIKFEQIRVIDKQRLIKKIGKIENHYVQNIHNAIEIIFDLKSDFAE
jgi:mRNA interferase MazF